MFIAWLRKGNSCKTCGLHTSHGITEPNMHLRLIKTFERKVCICKGKVPLCLMQLWTLHDCASSAIQTKSLPNESYIAATETNDSKILH
jgi:hypothetical protein